MASNGMDVARAKRTIISYAALCKDCGWTSPVPFEAHVHVLSTQHTVHETRQYLMEPPRG